MFGRDESSSPAGGEEKCQRQHDFLDDVAGQDVRRQRDDGVRRNGPRQRAEAERVRHEGLFRRENHVVAENKTASQQGCEHGESERGGVRGQRPSAQRPATCAQ